MISSKTPCFDYFKGKCIIPTEMIFTEGKCKRCHHDKEIHKIINDKAVCLICIEQESTIFFGSFLMRVLNTIWERQYNFFSFKLLRKDMGFESSNRSSIIFLSNALSILRDINVLSEFTTTPGNKTYKVIIKLSPW